MTAAELLVALRDALAAKYPTSIGETTTRPGTVTCVVAPDKVEYESAALCDPMPITVNAQVQILAAAGGETGIIDLIGQVDAVVQQITDSTTWVPLDWQPADVNDQPAITLTLTANGDG